MPINEIITPQIIKGANAYLSKHYNNAELSIYCSVDVRDAGFKIAPVDTNLFPGGFNNLSNEAAHLFIQHFKEYIAKYIHSGKILIIAEDYTRNLKYIESIIRLYKTISSIGFEVEIASITEERSINFVEGYDHKVSKLEKKDGKAITTSGFIPDIILLNNDLTSEVPDSLQNIEQVILPNPIFTWRNRRKHKHFNAYNRLVNKLSKELEFDPWFISTVVSKCTNVDFKAKEGTEYLAKAVDEVINFTQEKYNQYGIEQLPLVFIKADRGTHGIGIMKATGGQDIIAMNKKMRHSMHVIKHGVINDEVLVQEGVPTIKKHGGQAAENIIYLVGYNPIGNLIRSNPEQGEVHNLNSRGAVITAGNGCNDIENLVARIAACAVIDEISNLQV